MDSDRPERPPHGDLKAFIDDRTGRYLTPQRGAGCLDAGFARDRPTRLLEPGRTDRCPPVVRLCQQQPERLSRGAAFRARAGYTGNAPGAALAVPADAEDPDPDHPAVPPPDADPGGGRNLPDDQPGRHLAGEPDR